MTRKPPSWSGDVLQHHSQDGACVHLPPATSTTCKLGTTVSLKFERHKVESRRLPRLGVFDFRLYDVRPELFPDHLFTRCFRRFAYHRVGVVTCSLDEAEEERLKVPQLTQVRNARSPHFATGVHLRRLEQHTLHAIARTVAAIRQRFRGRESSGGSVHRLNRDDPRLHIAIKCHLRWDIAGWHDHLNRPGR